MRAATQSGRCTRWVLPILAFGLALAAPASAHDTWIAATPSMVPVGGKVVVDLTSGMAFPALDYAVRAERIERARLRLAGKVSQITKKGAGPHSLRFPLQPEAAGVATLWIELAPKGLDLESGKVEEYFAEIGASPESRRIWENAGPGRKWHEVYSKHAKTYIRVGDPADDRSWAEPVGMELEIVPERDPTALRPGDELPVRVLRAGKPFAGFPVGLVREGEEHGLLQTTDAEGRTTFRLAQKGRWLLRGTDLRPAAKPGPAPTVAWESDFTTLTFEIR